MTDRITAFDDGRLNASLTMILGLGEDVSSRRWRPIPSGLGSSRRASAAVVAALGAMACGCLAVYLGNGSPRRDDRAPMVTIAQDRTVALVASPPGPIIDTVVPAKPSPAIAARTGRVATRQQPRRGVDPAMPSRPTKRPIVADDPNTFGPQVVATLSETIPPMALAPQAASPAGDDPSYGPPSTIAVAATTPDRVRARRTSVQAIRALRRL